MDQRKLVFLFIGIVLFIVLCPIVSLAQKKDSPQVRIIAQYKERVDQIVTASGNVEIRYKDTKLFADWAELNLETKDKGNVTVHLPGEVISMKEIHINLDTSKGEFEKVHGLVKPTITYEAKSVKREKEDLCSD